MCECWQLMGHSCPLSICPHRKCDSKGWAPTLEVTGRLKPHNTNKQNPLCHLLNRIKTRISPLSWLFQSTSDLLKDLCQSSQRLKNVHDRPSMSRGCVCFSLQAGHPHHAVVGPSVLRGVTYAGCCEHNAKSVTITTGGVSLSGIHFICL